MVVERFSLQREIVYLEPAVGHLVDTVADIVGDLLVGCQMRCDIEVLADVLLGPFLVGKVLDVSTKPL